ncbi:C-type lectin domain family 4 member E isoform X2 [Mastacembelus armatus]|uniref:C-type lectin domain family 4 member E isoform X2 n=1 Tax=Mastacembelus armatus TaxID=205130 RepID=UPI000E458ABC|nr:C-type lectin domain family 4 member E-like isoform X2 [Mastacembelus armatus]
MEMQEITTEKERNQEDEGASTPAPEVKTEEETQDHYATLINESEDVYSEAGYSGAPLKTTGKQAEGNVRLYRVGCFFLTLLCLILLLVVIVLGVKLQTGFTVCPDRLKTATAAPGRHIPSITPACSYEQCQAHFDNIQPRHFGCRQCADGWLTFGRSCFYLSTFRLSWEESQKNCSSRGGSLAVITSQKVQNFLTKMGKVKYWIGLRNKGASWTWVNNTALQESFWAEELSPGDCGILCGKSPPEKNWITASCESYSYFICQLYF